MFAESVHCQLGVAKGNKGCSMRVDRLMLMVQEFPTKDHEEDILNSHAGVRICCHKMSSQCKTAIEKFCKKFCRRQPKIQAVIVI